MSWYVIYTKPNTEKGVSNRLIEKNIESYCPLIEEQRQWSDRKKRVLIPLFKSYVFVKLDNYKNDCVMVLQMPGVIKFIWWMGKPGIVKDKEIELIRDFLKEHKDSKIIVDNNVSKGDSVDIKDGPLIGLTGKFVSFRGKKVVLELETLSCRLVAFAEVKQNSHKGI